jgi:hypothetical protein
MRLVIVIAAMAGIAFADVCFIQRDIAETALKCRDGYRAVERHDRLGAGGYGEAIGGPCSARLFEAANAAS